MKAISTHIHMDQVGGRKQTSHVHVINTLTFFSLLLFFFLSRWKCQKADYTKLQVDELEVSWNDNTYKPTLKKCHKKNYHNDINYHMKQNKIFAGLALSCMLRSLGCELVFPPSIIDPQLIHKCPLQLLHKNVIFVNPVAMILRGN